MSKRLLSISSSCLLAFAATFVASAPWWRAFPVSTLVPLLLGAAAVAVVLPPLVALGLRRSATTSLALSVVAFVVYALGVTLQNLGAVDELLQGFTQGLARLLSVALPVSQPRWLYVAPVALTWLTGAATSELLTRDTGSGAAAVCWAASFSLAYSVTAGAPGNDVGWAVVLVVVAGFLVALRRYLPDLYGTTVDPDSTEGAPGGRRLRARPLAFGAASLGAAALIGIFAVPAVPALKGAPVTPARQPPVVSSSPLTPTAAMVELRNLKHPAPLFGYSANRTTAGYVSLADLDAYDGSSWSFTRTFHPTGGRVPPAVGAFADLRQQLVTERYQMLGSLDALDIPWMPYVDRPASVSGLPAGFGFDALTGMVVPETPLAAGAAYAVVSQPTPVTLATLGASQLNLGFASSPDPEDTLVPLDEQSGLSGVIKILQRQTGATAADPLTFLHAVAGEFRTKYRRLGGLANDTTFADSVHAVVTNHKATPEEFATVFALIARQLGVPARLVTGFRLAGPGSTPAAAVAGKTYTATSADAWTWVELPVNGLGWVVADPTPSKTGTPTLPGAAPGGVSTTTTSPQILSASRPQTDTHRHAQPTHFPKSHNSPDETGLIAGLAGALAVLLGLPGVILLRKALRRRRRRRLEDPALRVTAAWLEALDTLDEADLQGLGPLTNREVVERTRERFGEDAAGHALVVAERASTATFSSRPLIDRAQSEETWVELDALRRAVNRALPLRLRLRTTFAVARRSRQHRRK